MLTIEKSLIGAAFLYDKAILTDPCGPYADASRRWQGIPGVAVTPGGRVITVFYAGGDGEGCGNFLLLHASDGGEFAPVLAVVPTDAGVRCFDPVLWMHEGKLWLFWNQSHTLFDGRCGVWYAVCEDPDGAELRFSAPRRAANGIMMNKPTVTKGGAILLCCAIWRRNEKLPHTLTDELYSNVYRSTDGEHFSLIGGADYQPRAIDEHMIYERRDGSLRMLIRARDGIGEASSNDGGVTWENVKNSGIGGPDSRFHAARLASGRLLLVNHKNFDGRNNLTAMLSEDDGETWSDGILLDGRAGVSYPDAMQARDGSIYIIHDFDRYGEQEILLSRLTEADILAGKPVTDGSYRSRTIVKGSGARRAADSAAERYALAGLCEDASDGMQLLCTECTDSGLRAMLGIAGGFVWYGCLTLDRDSRCLAPRLSRIGDGIWEVSYTVGDETRTRSFALSDIRRFLG